MLLAPDPKDRAAPQTLRNGLVSVALHGLVFLAFVGVLHRAPTLATYKLPGTAQGTRLLSYYSPGSPERAVNTLAVKPTEKPKPTPAPSLHPALTAPQQSQTPALNAERGSGTSAQSGLGDGDISIALQKFFPYPKPDLTPLAHGTKGDVILDAVIDEQGHIAGLTLIQGLGPAVDDAVIATVRQWTYSPATKNGSPVRSEQELHFHYERS